MNKEEIDVALEWADKSHFNMNQTQEDHVNTITTAYENLATAYRKLQDENQRLREHCDVLLQQTAFYQAENQRLRKTLQEYTRPHNWQLVNGYAVWVGAGIGGELAIDALAEGEK